MNLRTYPYYAVMIMDHGFHGACCREEDMFMAPPLPSLLLLPRPPFVVAYGADSVFVVGVEAILRAFNRTSALETTKRCVFVPTPGRGGGFALGRG